MEQSRTFPPLSSLLSKIKLVIFSENFSSGLGAWSYTSYGVTLLEISGNKFARLTAGYPGDPAIMQRRVTVRQNINLTLALKVNGAGAVYVNQALNQIGSGNYDGTLAGFKQQSLTFNSGSSTTAEIMFMAYGHNFAVDDIVLSET